MRGVDEAKPLIDALNVHLNGGNRALLAQPVGPQSVDILAHPNELVRMVGPRAFDFSQVALYFLRDFVNQFVGNVLSHKSSSNWSIIHGFKIRSAPMIKRLPLEVICLTATWLPLMRGPGRAPRVSVMPSGEVHYWG
jgi:hypothetical protein